MTTLTLNSANSYQLDNVFCTYFEIKPQKNFTGWQIKKFLIDNIEQIDSLELLNSAHNSLFTSFDLYQCVDKPCPYFSEEYTHAIRIISRVKLNLHLEIELLTTELSLINIPFWNLTFKDILRSSGRYYIVKPRIEEQYGKRLVLYELCSNPWFD